MLSFKALYTLYGVYQVSESTHEWERIEGKKKVNGNKGTRGGKGSV